MGTPIPESPDDVYTGALIRSADVSRRTPEPAFAEEHATGSAEAERAYGLSARQREVLELVAACLEEAELADSAPYRARAGEVSAEVLDGDARRALTRDSDDLAAERG